MKFEPLDSFEVQGRGRAWSGYAPEDSAFEDGRDWIGKTVEIQGLTGHIIGVETMLLPRPIKTGDKISLLVQFD